MLSKFTPPIFWRVYLGRDFILMISFKFFKQGSFWKFIAGICEEKCLDIPIQELFHQKALDFN